MFLKKSSPSLCDITKGKENSNEYFVDIYVMNYIFQNPRENLVKSIKVVCKKSSKLYIFTTVFVIFMCMYFYNFFRIALNYVKQTFNVQLYQEIVTRMTEAWLVYNIYVFVKLCRVDTHNR